MLYVPEGEFLMGSDRMTGETQRICQQNPNICNVNQFEDQKPIHKVVLDAYWIDKTEVTNAMYVLCVKANVCKAPKSSQSPPMPNYSYENPQYADYPVIFVSWNDANKFCSWAGERLPTEAEWERVARGSRSDTLAFPWGNVLSCHYANSVDETTLTLCVDGTSPVGSYPDGASPYPYGALDMAGNVAEWVNDWYSPTYYEISPSSNPTGPSGGENVCCAGVPGIHANGRLTLLTVLQICPTKQDLAPMDSAVLRIHDAFGCHSDPGLACFQGISGNKEEVNPHSFARRGFCPPSKTGMLPYSL